MSSTVPRALTASRLIASRSPLAAVRSPNRAFAPILTSSQRAFTATANANAAKMPELKSFDHPIATLDSSMAHRLPEQCPTLFEAKKAKKLSFEEIAKVLGRDEVAVAALFYGQSKASEEDVAKLSELLGIEHSLLHSQLYGWPDRGRSIEMPPKEPLIYRLYEIVQNYGYAYKAILNEKFGDGIMSAITFSTNVKKETDQAGDWVVITMRGKWLPYKRF